MQLSTQQLRGRLFQLPRPSRRHEHASPIEDSLNRGLEPRRPPPRTQQRLHRRRRRAGLSCLPAIVPTPASTPQARGGFTLLALATTRHRRHAQDGRSRHRRHPTLALCTMHRHPHARSSADEDVCQAGRCWKLAGVTDRNLASVNLRQRCVAWLGSEGGQRKRLDPPGRHVASRVPQRRGASWAGQLAGRQHIHRPAEGEADQHGVVEDPAADHAGAGSVGSPRARRRWPVPRPVVGRHRARPARSVTGLATELRTVSSELAAAVRTNRCSGATKTAGSNTDRSRSPAGCRRGTRERPWRERRAPDPPGPWCRGPARCRPQPRPRRSRHLPLVAGTVRPLRPAPEARTPIFPRMRLA